MNITFANLVVKRLVFLAFCTLSLTFGIASTNSNAAPRTSGEVKMFGETFTSMSEYVESDVFRNNGGRCGFEMAQPRARSHGANRLTEPQANPVGDCTASLTKIQGKYNLSSGLVINVWFHVIQNTSGAGAISNAEINAQIQALNEDYLALGGTVGQDGYPTKISFKLAGITRTTNTFWYNDSQSAEIQYKSALGRDQSKFLNVYATSAGGFLGYAYFPSGGIAGSVLDGVTILSDSVGGRNNGFSVYDQGRTLTHEVGHYLGLEHTFGRRNTCSNTFSGGDFITDTPAENASYDNTNGSCPNSISAFGNTCGVQRAIANYMNYNRDSCMDNFTSQQSNRMVCSLLTYRPMLGNVVETSTGLITPVYNLLLDEDEPI